jgi:integrase
MTKALTDIAIQNLKAGQARYEVPDPGARGLRVIVQPSGRKSYAVRYRNAAGRPRKLTLPAGITLAAARKLAADSLLEVAQGKDPATVKQATRQTARVHVDDTVERLAHQFITQYAKRQTRENSWRQTGYVFKNDVLPAWGKRNVHEISRRDVRGLLDGIAGDRPVMANRVRGVLSKFFGWLAERDVITSSPMVGIKAPTKEIPRERVLSDDELKALWLAADAIDEPAGACIKILMLTAARRSEIARLKWSEVPDGDALMLPAKRMKGKAAHIIPLSTQAAAIIAAQPQVGDYVFGKTPVGHFHRIKFELATHMKLQLDTHMKPEQLNAPMERTAPWVIHDIRRSVATGMAKLGIAIPVIERLLAHKSGTFKGVVGIYQRHSFLPELAVAVQRWADHLDQLVGRKSAKVVRLRRR